MLKDISSFKLQGANFSSTTVLPILDFSDGKYIKVSLIYGRNGSGKSTIAKAFKKIKGEVITFLITTDVIVLPKNVSVGERNIIGLCYFFTSIMAGKNKDTAYNDEYLIIIDDPISSYDFENRIGILSFLKHKLSQFLDGNINSKAIVMTHDLLTLFDFEKICEELNENWKNTFRDQELKYHL